jgi:hypothetical protein
MSTQIERIVRSERIPLAWYLLQQLREVLSDLNRWCTGEALRREPTMSELWDHYIDCGRAEQFADIHSDMNIWSAGKTIGCDPLSLPEEIQEAILFAVWDLWQELLAKYPHQCEHVLTEDSV